MSSGNFSEPKTYRQFFIERWQAFLRENFDGPLQVAVCFSVHHDTAVKWWEGLNAPSGWFVSYATMHPDLGPALSSAMERAA